MTLDAPTVALIAAVPTTILGILAYRRSQKIDKIAAQAGIATSEAGSIQQVVEGLKDLIAILQDDNKVSRRRIDGLEVKLDTLEQIEEDCKKQLAALNERMRELLP